ncbi:MAG: Wzz/FepE/Etk N-terminal domain-containing protein [Chloroflexota bacterium]|nr:Wzz/FepE/Etk N-terminal domain-containing protein [Chloroflexota bacterium]
MAGDSTHRPSAIADASEPGVRITLAQIRAFLPRYKWMILGVFLFTAVSAYTALSLMTELYDAHAAVLVKLGRENLDAPLTARNGVLSTGVRREELGSEVEILRSTALIEQVVNDIGLEAFRVERVPPPGLIGKAKFYTKAALRWGKTQYQEVLFALDLKKRLTEHQAAVALVTDQLTVAPQKEADVIALHLRLADPALAVRIQETLIQKYLAHRVDVRRNSGVKEFFEREVAQLRDRLRSAESAANAWRRQLDLTVPSEQKALLLRQIADLSTQHERSASRSRALSSQVTAARGLIGTAVERVRATQVENPSPAVQQFRERLTRLEADRAKLLTTYLPEAAPVKTVDEEVATIRRLLDAQAGSEVGSVTTELNPLRQQLEQSVNQDTVALEGLTAELTGQQRQLATLRDQLRRLDAADVTLMELERERELAEQQYLDATRRLAAAGVESQLDVNRISNVSIAVPPAASPSPVYPRKMLIMPLALAVGLVLGLALAVAREWTSETVHAAEDVEAATDLICLASFGAQGGQAGRGSRGVA